MFYLFISLIGSVIASIAYKASTEMGCRRMQHLLVERSILAAGNALTISAEQAKLSKRDFTHRVEAVWRPGDVWRLDRAVAGRL